MGGRLTMEEDKFMKGHVPDNCTADDVDESTKMVIGLAMLANRQDLLLINLTGEMAENTIRIEENRMLMRQNFSAFQQDITSL